MARTRLIDKKSLAEIEAEERGYADRRSVEAFASGLSANYLQCRELGHNWRPFSARRDNEYNCFERALRCTRCRTKRHETLSFSGAKLRSHYEYPDGYTTDGLGRIVGEGRDALRLESMTRSIIEVHDSQAS